MDLKDVIKRTNHAYLHYGRERQIRKAIEEFGELTAELARVDFNHSDLIRYNLLVELADAMIMLLQMWHMVGFNECRSMLENKLYKLDKRIMEELPPVKNKNLKGGESYIETLEDNIGYGE